jgi:hypothetical protein
VIRSRQKLRKPLNEAVDAPGRNRTCDLALRRRALYPLSYRRFESVSLAAPRRAALPASAPTVLGRALPGKVACAKRETFHGDSEARALSPELQALRLVSLAAHLSF